MKVLLKGLVIICLLVSLTSCWDVQDITKRAYITAIGLDQIEGREEDNYKVTFEIVLPQLLNPQHRERKATLVETIEASSVGGAIEKLQARISRQLTLAHVRVVLIGENLAKEKHILDIIDFFQRNPNIQMRIRLLVVQDAKAEDILKLEPIYDQYIAKEIVEMAQLNFALARNISFLDFVSELREKDGRGLITRALALKEKRMIILHGAGVYDQWHLHGWLNNEETKHANWLLVENNFIIDANEGDGLYTFMVESKSVKITPTRQNERLGFDVQIKTIGPLMQEQGEQIDASNPETIRRLEKVFAKTIKAQAESAIQKAQNDFRIDYLGFDSALKKTDPQTFAGLDWKELFPNIPIKVSVEAKVTRFGLSK